MTGSLYEGSKLQAAPARVRAILRFTESPSCAFFHFFAHISLEKKAVGKRPRIEMNTQTHIHIHLHWTHTRAIGCDYENNFFGGFTYFQPVL